MIRSYREGAAMSRKIAGIVGLGGGVEISKNNPPKKKQWCK